MLNETIDLARKYHEGILRKHTNLPYITHPLNVLNHLGMMGITDVDLHKAAVCHDLLEDTNITPEELKNVIGERAFLIVQELTFVLTESYTKKDYLLSFLREKSIEALIIKIVDRYDNVLDFHKFDPKYAKIYFRKATPLWQALENRKGEIVQLYGQEVYHQLDKLYRSLSELCSS